MQNRMVVEIEIRLFQLMRRALRVEWNQTRIQQKLQ